MMTLAIWLVISAPFLIAFAVAVAITPRPAPRLTDAEFENGLRAAFDRLRREKAVRK